MATKTGRLYKGSFKNRINQNVTVEILRTDKATELISMGGDNDEIKFHANDTVEITCEVNDTWDHVIQHSATIRLLVKHDMPDFFCADCRKVQVNIFIDEACTMTDVAQSKCVFAGFVEPQSYQQPYDDTWDELEIQCIDMLSASAKHNYADLTPSTYADYTSQSGSKSFLSIIQNILFGGSTYDSNMYPDIEGLKAGDNLWYDGSVSLTSRSGRYAILSQISIDDLLFLGDEVKDLKKNQDVLKELMQYLNLRIVQKGLAFYIFSYDSVKKLSGTSTLEFHCLTSTSTKTLGGKTTWDGDVNSSGWNAVGNTSISRESICNQIKVKCDTDTIDTIVENPLDEDSLTTPYTKAERYCREYGLWVDEEYGSEEERFRSYITGGSVEVRDDEWTEDWYIQLYNHKDWNCSVENDGTSQQKKISDIPLFSSAFVRIGNNARSTDNDMYMVTKLDGNFADASKVLCRYVSSKSVGNISPSDSASTNYLVINGSFFFNIVKAYNMSRWCNILNKDNFTDALNWKEALPYAKGEHDFDGTTNVKYYGPWAGNDEWMRAKQDDEKTEHAYYLLRWFDGDVDATSFNDNMMPPTSKNVHRGLFHVAGNAKNWAPVLNIRIKVGNKCLNGNIEDGFYWEDNGNGFVPIVIPPNDKSLLGSWHDIYNMNGESSSLPFSEKGMLIPIKSTDNLRGQVTVEILGGYYMMWDFQDGGKYVWQSYDPETVGITITRLTPLIDAIWIKDFSIKIVSDNGNVNNTSDDVDIVYATATDETFQNEKEITFKISSALTTAERQNIGITAEIMRNNPTTAGGVVTSLYDRVNDNGQRKPEEIYIDSAYRDHATAKITIETEMLSDKSAMHQFRRLYTDGKEFYPFGISENLQMATQTIKAKEI